MARRGAEAGAHGGALRADRDTIVRAGALLFGAGALLSAVTLPIPHSAAVDVKGFVVLTVVSALLAAALAAFGRHLPSPALALLPGLGTVLCSCAVAFADPVTDNEVLYLLAVLWTALFFSTRVSIANVAFIAVAYATTLALTDAPQAVPRWCATTASLAVATAVIVELRSRLDALVRAQALDARTDPLTGLDNRRAFDEALAEELVRAARTGRPFSLLAADLDRFKAVNDRHGHATGDRVLQQVATVLRHCARSVDLVARPGGEEFAVLMPETGHAAALVAAERMRAAVEGAFAADDVPLTVSIGVATHPDDGGQATDLLAVSDERLYVAKRGGRNALVGADSVTDS